MRAQQSMAAKTAASGNVPTQEDTIEAITRLFALPDNAPIPNREPTLTWVVETGIPKREAKMTKKAVTRLAEKLDPDSWPSLCDSRSQRPGVPTTNPREQ